MAAPMLSQGQECVLCRARLPGERAKSGLLARQLLDFSWDDRIFHGRLNAIIDWTSFLQCVIRSAGHFP
jgi:hypothetical protein